MTLYYHMFGDDVDTLNVYSRTENGGPLHTMFTKTGNIGDWFERAEMIVPILKGPFQVGDAKWARSIYISSTSTFLSPNWHLPMMLLTSFRSFIAFFPLHSYIFASCRFRQNLGYL